MTFVSYVTESFVPGLRALIRSMQANSRLDAFDFVVVHEELSEAAVAKLLAVKAGLTFIPRKALGEINVSRPWVRPNHRWNIQKLTIFNLPRPGETLAYVDADMLCVGDLTAIQDWTHLTAPIVFGNGLPRSVFDRPMFSTGLFAFKPDHELFELLSEYAFENYGKRLKLSDQAMLNEFFWFGMADQVHLVGIEWEMLKRVWRRHPKIWKAVTNKRFVHFVGPKPWLGGEKGYAKLEAVWRRYA